MLRSKNIFLLWQQQVSVLAESRLKRYDILAPYLMLSDSFNYQAAVAQVADGHKIHKNMKLFWTLYVNVPRAMDDVKIN